MSGFNASPRVLFDTTVLCGAILSAGINRRLLTLAAQTVDFRVVLSRCLMEFYHNAVYKGIGDRVYSVEIVDAAMGSRSVIREPLPCSLTMSKLNDSP